MRHYPPREDHWHAVSGNGFGTDFGDWKRPLQCAARQASIQMDRL